MSLVYLLSKFSQEAMLVELLLLGLIGTSYFGYLLFKKRKYGVAKKQIPDHVVRAFLIDMMSRSEGFKNQLFGESFHIPTNVISEPHLHASAQAGAHAAPAMKIADGPAGKVDDAALQKLRAELQTSLSKGDELGKALAKIQDEKAALEAKLAQSGNAPAAAAGGAGGADSSAELKEAQDKISKLEAKLTEYEVIEDDLANLKRYQQENKQLKAQMAAQQNGGGGAALAATPPPAPVEPPPPPPPLASDQPEMIETPIEEVAAAEPEPSALSAAEDAAATAGAEKDLADLAGKVEESLTDAPEAPLGASVNDPLPPPPAEEAAPEAAVAEAEAKPGDKTDADLLSEFEKMLSS